MAAMSECNDFQRASSTVDLFQHPKKQNPNPQLTPNSQDHCLYRSHIDDDYIWHRLVGWLASLWGTVKRLILFPGGTGTGTYGWTIDSSEGRGRATIQLVVLIGSLNRSYQGWYALRYFLIYIEQSSVALLLNGKGASAWQNPEGIRIGFKNRIVWAGRICFGS
jgi:hypothetical protein